MVICTTASPDDINESLCDEIGHLRRHLFDNLIILPHFIGKPAFG